MSAHISTAEERLKNLRSGGPWQEAYEIACKVDDGERDEDWGDASLIAIYKECLVRGLTFQAAPEAFLEACKRLSRLLFRYGRAREANNFLLQLRDLSPDPSKIPAWAWAYSAKLAYLEDIEYCITNPDSVLDYIEAALSTDSSNVQALAVLADFITSASKHLAERSDSATADRLSDAVRSFLTDSSVPPTESIDGALSRLDSLLDRDTPEGLEEAPLPEPPTTLDAVEREEIERLRAELEETNIEVEALAGENETLRKRNEALLLELHMLRDQAVNESTAFARLAALIERLEIQLEKLSAEAESALDADTTPPIAAQPTPAPLSAPILSPRSRILVIGESRAADQHLLGICKAMGLEKDHVDFRLSFDAFDSLDINSLQYNDSVAGILIGPVPHKVPGQDDPVQALMRGEGYPPTVRVETSSGELKITKSSFREALETLLTRIASLEPSLH